MAYRADIEIGVKGADKLRELQERVVKLSRAVEDANVKTLIDRSAVQSVNEYTSVVAKAADTLRETAIQLNAAGKASGNYADAISQYVTAIGQANAAQQIQNSLIADEIELRRKQKLAQSGIRETTQYTGPIGPGQASAIGTLAGQKSPVAERVQRTIQAKRDEADLQAALLRLEQKSADTLNEKLQLQQNLVQGTREVLELLAQQEQKARFLAGKSGTMMQGPLPPLAQAGAMGFPVALSQTAAERESLALNAKKQQILERMAATRQQLSGLAANLQRLEQNSVVAIADAGRAQERLNDAKEQAVKLAERELTISKQGALISGRFSPVGGAENIPGSPAAIRAQTRRRRESLSNAVIGGAFPLLFGQGAGAALGGGLGGAAGGLAGGQFGFGLSLVGTALGQTIDTFITKTTELGGALLSVSSTFDTLKERALISNREREKEIQLLQDAGFAATANAVAQEELFKTIGANGVESLRQLGTESDRLNRTWAELSVQIQAVVAGPLADLAARLNDFFGPKAVAGRVSALREDLTPQRRAQLNRELIALGGPGSARFGAAKKGLNEVEIELAARKFPEKVQALLDKYGPMRVGAEIKYDPKQVREQTVNILQKRLEVIDITAKFKEAGEKQRELDKQRYDLIEGYENSIAAIRRRIEDEISNKRLSVLQKENQLLDVQAQIRQESLALANAQALTTAGQGLPTAAQFGGNNPFRTRAFKDVAQQAAEAAGSFLEQELSLAEQAAKLKRDAALDALRTDIEAAKFQADTAREVNKLNIDTAKRVAEINASIRKQNASQDNRRFEIEQKLAIIRLQTLQAEFSLLATRAPTDNLREEAQILTQFSIAATKYVEAQKAPAPLKELGGIGAQGVSFAGLDAINAQLKLTQDRINAAQLALNDLLVLKNEQEFVAKMQRIAESIDAPLQTLTEELVANEATRTRYAELIREGVRGVVAERLIEVEQLKEAAVLQYDAVILELEKKLQIDSTNEKLKEQITLYKERRDAVAGKAATAIDAIKEEESPAARLQAAITKAREELTELANPINAAVTGANAIGSAFSQAFQGIATGTMTAQEALSNFFKSIGEAFVSMAAEIIAKQLVMITLQTILKALGVATSAGGGGGGGSGGGISDIGNWQQYAFEGPGVPFTPPATFATGGFVTGPTRALIGEGGEPEYVIPQSKMSAAMSRYSRGARGESVIPGNGTSTESAGGTAVATAPIDVRYTVERINSVDYVTADQFQAGMRQAAAQGAKQGEQRALNSLRQNTTTRRKVGI